LSGLSLEIPKMKQMFWSLVIRTGHALLRSAGAR
jgi:hypothetical protein